MSEWISVKDRLPDIEIDQVLVYIYIEKQLGNVRPIAVREYEIRFANPARYNDRLTMNVWGYGDYDYEAGWTVTHWMPLPDPPKLEDSRLHIRRGER